MSDEAAVRVDVWLWAVRAFRTRTISKDACKSGRVRVGGVVAKPATKVSSGDEVAFRAGGHKRLFRVERTVSKRVGAVIAVDCYEDLSPPVIQPLSAEKFEAAQAIREPGAGRPTKRDRRRLDRLRRS